MNIIRVTKTSRNRVDAIFTGYQYLFFHADFGLVAVAKREMNGITSGEQLRYHAFGTDKRENDNEYNREEREHLQQ